MGFISYHLTADKLFPVNPRAITGPPKMSLLLDAKSMPALIINPTLLHVTHTDDLGWYIVQPGGTDVRAIPELYCQQAKCYARADPVLHHRLYIPVYLMFQENFQEGQMGGSIYPHYGGYIDHSVCCVRWIFCNLNYRTKLSIVSIIIVHSYNRYRLLFILLNILFFVVKSVF